MATPTAKILLKRGSSSAFSTVTLHEGEPAFLTDTGKLYVGTGGVGAANVLINPDLGTAAGKNTGTAVGDVIEVQPGGKIDPSIIPSAAITDVFVVADEAARLALNANVGDVAVQTDVNKSYILQAEPASEDDNWVELLAAGYVTSVNGATGDVVIGISNIENLQTALNAKADLSGATFTGPVSLTVGGTSITQETTDNSTNIATTAFVKNVVQAIAAGVTEVNGMTGAVTLTGADIDITGYTKAATAGHLEATDTVNEALGKLEKCLEVVDGGTF